MNTLALNLFSVYVPGFLPIYNYDTVISIMSCSTVVGASESIQLSFSVNYTGPYSNTDTSDTLTCDSYNYACDASRCPITISGWVGGGDTVILLYGYRYYSSQIGRWLSRDPIGEKGGNNLYAFAMNNTLSFVDAKGDSPKDVIKIYRIYRVKVNAMTYAGERHADPYINNEMRFLYDLSGKRLGKRYQGCNEQAATVAYELINQTYDDKWSFMIEQRWYLYHTVGKAKPSNQCDPEITFDPWNDEIYITSEPTSIWMLMF